MLHKIVQQQCEGFDEEFFHSNICHENMRTLKEKCSCGHEEVKNYFKEGYVDLIEAEIARKKGMMKQTLEDDSLMLLTRYERETYGEEVLGYNQAIQEDIAYLEKELEELKKIN